MALIFMDGFDKYGPLNTNNSQVPHITGIFQTEWTTVQLGGSGSAVSAPLSATGFSVTLANIGTLTKTLPGNYARLIGGVRFSASLGNNCGINFVDGASGQCGIRINIAGTISIVAVNISGTVIATSTASVLANSTHYLEWDLTFSNTGAYQIWLDGVSILSGTADLTGSANNYANQISLSAPSSVSLTIDDLYLFDTTGSTNNAVLLTSPRIETTFPISDSQAQFEFGAATLGLVHRGVAGSPSATANNLTVRAVTPTRNCTLNSVSFLTGTGSATVQLRAVCYTDNGGVPNTLMSAGPTIVGTTSNSSVTLPLTTPQNLTAGVQYWIGVMNDISASSMFGGYDGAVTARWVISTFASGAPATCPATALTTSVAIFGNITNVGANFYEVGSNQPYAAIMGGFSYVYDSVVNQEDLYNFAALRYPPITIYAVAVKALASKSDVGTRTISVRTKSGSTDSGGSLTGQSPGSSFTWFTSNFERDPNGSIAWTASALNAATSGFKIDS